MKITWFAGMTFRVQIAGRTIVVDPEGAPTGVDAAELTSGAETIVSARDTDVPLFSPEAWRPRKRVRLIDQDEGDEALGLHRLGLAGLVADSADEGVLVLADASFELRWGRWADGAVIVLSGPSAPCAAAGIAMLDVARPKLIALAVADDEIDGAFDTLAPELGDAGLIVLEAGMAVEV